MRKNAQIRLKRLFGYSYFHLLNYSSFSFGSKNAMMRKLDVAEKIYSLMILAKNNFIRMQLHFKFFKEKIFNFQKPFFKFFFRFINDNKVVGIAIIKRNF